VRVLGSGEGRGEDELPVRRLSNPPLIAESQFICMLQC
jgi:hypothetical protein